VMRSFRWPTMTIRSIQVGLVSLALWLGMPSSWADSCDAALQTVETSAVLSLECRVLYGLDDRLRVCVAPRGDRLEHARYGVAIALRRCSCTSVSDADALSRKTSRARTVYDLANLSASLEQAQACSSTDEQRSNLKVIDNKIQQLKQAQAYCGTAAADIDRFAQEKASTCYQARLRRAAAGYAAACGNGVVSEEAAREIAATEAQVCGDRVTPSCEATLAFADRLRRSQRPTDERQLWNLVATRLIAGASPRAKAEERECANRMIAIAAPTDAVADRNDRMQAESVGRDPQLRDRFATALRAAVKESGEAKELAQLLNNGADIKEVLAKASQLNDDEQRRRFFGVAGGLGRALEAARAVSAFEQNARGFDIVIAPKPKSCQYADFVNVLLAGIHKATPAKISLVDRNQATQATAALVAARKRSCGNAAPEATSGPGCGAVVEVQVEERANGRGGGQVRLNFVSPDGRGGAIMRVTQTIRVPDFLIGCGSDSEESAAALRLVFDLQFAFATNPRESAVVLDRPVRAEVCGLRALPPAELPAGKFDGGGLRILGQELDAKLVGPSNGAREALQVWKHSIGQIDPKTANASLRFSSSSYRDPKGNRGEKLEADLKVNGQMAASFATVVLGNANDCSASIAERYEQAGRMIGNEAGSFLARQAIRSSTGQTGANPGRRRWFMGAALGELGLVAGGLTLLSQTHQSSSLAQSGDSGWATQRVAGEAMLVTAGVGALVIAIYAAATH
jgi:hypothetical protein